MRWINVRVLGAVDQKHWRRSTAQYVFRRCLPQVHAILPASVNKCRPDQWRGNHVAERGRNRKTLGDPVDGNSPETCEWALSHDSLKAMFDRERLQQDSGAQRRAYAEDVARMPGSLQPVYPAMNVVCFEYAIGDNAAATLSVTSAVRR